MFKIRTFFLLFFHVTSFLYVAGQEYGYYGVIKLEDKNENAITYKLNIKIENGIITGHSITDVSGIHETKNLVRGVYNYKNKTLEFYEDEIVYTKSHISKSLFCFVSFKGKVNLSSKKTKLIGPFTGKFKNKEKCIDGTLNLIGEAKVNKLLNKASRMIQKSKKVDEATKRKYDPTVVFDSLNSNRLSAFENLNIFSKDSILVFEIWDKNIEDGDIINLYHNEHSILYNYKVTKAVKQLVVPIKSEVNVFKLQAVNTGLSGSNTAMILIKGSTPVEFQSNLKANETSTITIIR